MSSQENWDLRIDTSVFKFLQKTPRRYSAAILVGIRLLSTNPFFGDVQKMKGEDNVWRLRIGAYRVFYKIFSKEKIILVFHVERRTSKTY